VPLPNNMASGVPRALDRRWRS